MHHPSTPVTTARPLSAAAARAAAPAA